MPNPYSDTEARAGMLACLLVAYAPDQLAAFADWLRALAAALAERTPIADQLGLEISADLTAPLVVDDEWRQLAGHLVGAEHHPDLPPVPRLRTLLQAIAHLEAGDPDPTPISEAAGEAVRYALARCPAVDRTPTQPR